MQSLGLSAGLLGIVITIWGFMSGGTQSEESKLILRWGIGLIILGVVAGNGLLDN